MLFVLNEFVWNVSDVPVEKDNELMDRLLPIPVLKRNVEVSRFVVKMEDVWMDEPENAVALDTLIGGAFNELTVKVESVSSLPVPTLKFKRFVERLSAVIEENWEAPPPASKKTVLDDAVTIIFPNPTKFNTLPFVVVLSELNSTKPACVWIRDGPVL